MAHLGFTEPQAPAQTQEMIPAQEREVIPPQEREIPPAQKRAVMLWLPTISRELTSLLVSVVVFHGRSLGLDVAVVEVHDLWLTTPEVVVSGNASAVGQFEYDVLRGCAFLETGGLRDIDPRTEPHRYAEAFANWLAQQSDSVSEASEGWCCDSNTHAPMVAAT